MIADVITFALCHQFIYGVAIGAMGFGGALGPIGWFLGHDHAMRKATGWMSEKTEAHGDVPMLPPVRDRRFSSVEHRGLLS